jgi:hypothetical protein
MRTAGQQEPLANWRRVSAISVTPADRRYIRRMPYQGRFRMRKAVDGQGRDPEFGGSNQWMQESSTAGHQQARTSQHGTID